MVCCAGFESVGSGASVTGCSAPDAEDAPRIRLGSILGAFPLVLVLRHGEIDYVAAKGLSDGVNDFVMQSICAGVPYVATVTTRNTPRVGTSEESCARSCLPYEYLRT
jgi:hypothetical protein